MAESLADEIKRGGGGETIVSDLTYDLRSGDPDFVGRNFPLSWLQSRLRCPMCGARQVALIYALLTNTNVLRGRAPPL